VPGGGVGHESKSNGEDIFAKTMMNDARPDCDLRGFLCRDLGTRNPAGVIPLGFRKLLLRNQDFIVAGISVKVRYSRDYLELVPDEEAILAHVPGLDLESALAQIPVARPPIDAVESAGLGVAQAHCARSVVFANV
jgi:hypothetical protein